MGTQVVLALLILAVLAEVKSEKPYKICSLNKNDVDCVQLKRSDDVICENNHHGIDCLLNIEQGKADFGRVTPEEALIAANFVSDVVVLGEFRSDAIHDDAAYATVVLVRADYEGGFKGLQGKKYCHPGFKFDHSVTDLILKEFETTVLKDNGAEGCANKVDSGTILEKELKAVADFFGPSCRPGPWIDVEDRNTKLYNQYSKLCKLCAPNGQCTVPAGTVPFRQPLECLVDRGGDVALTTLNTVYEFFNRSENINRKANYKYLCRNGSVNSLDNLCTWSKQPWELIVANKNQAELVKTDLMGWLSKHTIAAEPTYTTPSADFEKSLIGVLFPAETQYNRVNFTSETVSLTKYMQEYRTIPNSRDSEKCKQNLKWCTTSDAEQQKCRWLAQASLNYAIQPVIECFQSPNRLACLEDIKDDKADVVTSDAHYGYIARKKNLAALAYPETDRDNLIKTIIVVKEGDASIQRFENLKNKKACMPEYGGIEWLSFINTAREHKVLSKKTCDYGELLSEFVGDSCVPGARDPEHEKSSTTNENKMCALCVPHPYYTTTAANCNADETNKYYGNVGSLKCLKEVGDFAVITQGDYSRNITESEFRVLCKNGSLAAYTGFKVDKGCVLTTIVDSEVVSKRSSTKNGDIGITLLNFEKRFGTDRVKPFEVFNIFNNTKDLLFKDSTLGLTSINSDKEHIKNYKNLFAHVDQCFGNNDPDSATGIQATVLPLLLTFIVFFYAKW